jgi:hypothetical protein
MKTNELRVNNQVNYIDEEEGILPNKIDIQDLEMCDSKNNTFNKLHKPIELKECIEKVGFENKDYGYSKKLDIDTTLRLTVSNGWFYPRIEQAPEFSNEKIQVVSLKRIKYLHELQNLWYVLKQEELIW